jgi:hypothetical protein
MQMMLKNIFFMAIWNDVIINFKNLMPIVANCCCRPGANKAGLVFNAFWLSNIAFVAAYKIAGDSQEVFWMLNKRQDCKGISPD